jgi:ribonuclease BN (tRNA processing enzyme)
MKLVLLGTAGYHPSAGRHTACLMLPELGIVLDAGTGFFRVRDHLATDELDIFLTHAHLDHIVGLSFMYDVLAGRPMRRVTVHGDERTLRAVEQHLLAEPLFPVKLPCDYRRLERVAALAGGGRLTHVSLAHPGGSRAFRLEWPGRSLAYVTDTTADPAADYVAAIRGVDLLVHECNFKDGCEEHAALTGHSCATSVAQVARAAGTRRLLLVHVNPLDDSDDPVGLVGMRAIFPATELGQDLMEVDF